MARYTNGSAALADARLRVNALGPMRGILMLEGRDDALVFANRVPSLESIVTCGNKKILKEAFEHAGDSDRKRIIFVADCDYDVPAGLLHPGEGLVLSRLTDREADFAQLGVVKSVALRAIPTARESDAAADQIASDVLAKAIALAEVVGKVRYLSSINGMGLCFDGFELRRYRRKADGHIKSESIIEAIKQRSVDAGVTYEQIAGLLDGSPSGVDVCHGKDLIQALAAVIHQDYGVSLANLAFIPELFRSIEDGVFEAWDVVERIRRWEEESGSELLG